MWDHLQRNRRELSKPKICLIQCSAADAFLQKLYEKTLLIDRTKRDIMTVDILI